MKEFFNEIKNANTIVICGHVRPDGDCIGACLSLLNYINLNFSDKSVDLYLEEFNKNFNILKGSEKINNNFEKDKQYDLFIALDSGDTERLGQFIAYYESAKRRVCIDHHISNEGYGDVCIIDKEASSTCEILYDLYDKKLISKEIAQCLFVGLVHDTGVFKHSNVTKKVMYMAGDLVELGAVPNELIYETYSKKSYVQTQLTGRALLESFLIMDGKCIVTCVKQKIFKFYHATHTDLDGVVDNLRNTEGVECAVFIYENEDGSYKVSMRSSSLIDVSAIAVYFGGGGHKRAAGYTTNGSFHDVINNLSAHLEKQLELSEASKVD